MFWLIGGGIEVYLMSDHSEQQIVRSVHQLLLTANVAPSSTPSGTSALTRATRPNLPEDLILNSSFSQICPYTKAITGNHQCEFRCDGPATDNDFLRSSDAGRKM
jgi:hypothetical protein